MECTREKNLTNNCKAWAQDGPQVYSNPAEYHNCITFSQWFPRWSATPPSSEANQAAFVDGNEPAMKARVLTEQYVVAATDWICILQPAGDVNVATREMSEETEKGPSFRR